MQQHTWHSQEGLRSVFPGSKGLAVAALGFAVDGEVFSLAASCVEEDYASKADGGDCPVS